MNTFVICLQALNSDLLLTRDPADFQIYSKDGTGYIPGEGAGMLLIEDLQHAQDRGAHIHAEIVGYGKSSDGCYFAKDDMPARIESMAMAIRQALHEADMAPEEVDLICGTSDGTAARDAVEIGAIRSAFGEARRNLPFVNYNAWFGLVESCVGILNIAVVTEIMKRGEILPIPYTENFCAEDIAFVTQPLKKTVRNALVLGATEGGNHYAVVLRSMA